MPKVENFSEKEQLMEALERVGAKVEEIKKRESGNIGEPSFTGTLEDKKEVVKRSVREIAEEEIKGTEEEEEKLSAEGESEERNYLPNYMAEENVGGQTGRIVESLLQTVVDKGIMRALRDSKKYSPFIQDAFHDALVDKLVPELEKRGKI